MPPPEGDTLAAVTSEVVGQIQDRARPLGLTWQLVKATVTAVASSAQCTILLDGDTVPVGAISMIGGFPAGTRVWVMIVPPGGLYIVGQFAGAYRMLGANQSTASPAASSSGAQDAISSGNWTTEPTYEFLPGRMFRVIVSYEVDPNAAGLNVSVIRVRLGQATTTGTVLAQQIVENNSGIAVGFTLVGYFANTGSATVSSKLSLTITRASGAATVTLNGTQAGGDQRAIVMAVEEIGPSDMTGLAGLVATV